MFEYPLNDMLQRMAGIDQFLEADHSNIPLAKKLLDRFSPELMGALEEAASIFQTLSRCFGEGAHDEDDAIVIQREIDEAKRDPAAYIREELLVEPDAQPSPETIASEAGKLAIARIYSRRARGTLKLHIFRSFIWAVTDLLRLRATAAQGHLRVEVEAAALVKIMAEDPFVAWRWFSIKNNEAGRRFFRENQGRIGKVLRRYEMHETYQTGSAMAQHPRFAGVARGISFAPVQEELRGGLKIELRFQELDPDRPESFILVAGVLARTQERVFRALLEGMPEVTDKILIDGRLPLFNAKIERIWLQVAKTFPDFVARWQRSRAGGP